jgi:IMP dehydrogenase/GMP reductase
MITDIKFDLNDIVLVPKAQSEINSRNECNPFTIFEHYAMLPLLASPMDTVVSADNYKAFLNNNIIPCLPRGFDRINTSINRVYFFQAFGLCDIEKKLKFDDTDINYFYKFPNVLIDIANGNMKKIIDIVKEIKRNYPTIIIMVGNIANPKTFVKLSKAGADYVRCSIGTGAGCTTAANVAINYPMGSLISECAQLKKQYNLNTKIVADGGMRNYSDIIKALALGADYIMIGNLFNKAIESAGFNYLYGIKINNKLARILWKYNFPVKKKYRGMSTKAVQRNWGKTKLITAEGITKYQKVEYTLEQWTENFKDYLKSAMSYSNAKTLNEFIGKADYCQITKSAYDRFNK